MEQAGKSENQFNNVFIKNLGENVTDDELRKLFEPFGNISSMVLARDANDQTKSRGYGFVCFSEPQSAKNAVNELNGKVRQLCLIDLV